MNSNGFRSCSAINATIGNRSVKFAATANPNATPARVKRPFHIQYTPSSHNAIPIP